MSPEEYIGKIKSMIDDLKAMSTELGLSNTGDEYKIIAELFTYKFLNDKLLFDFENREDKNESFDTFVTYADSNTAKMEEKHLIDSLYQEQNKENFHKIFDQALVDISTMNKDVYSIETISGKKQSLFEPLASYIRDENKEHELAKRAINILSDYKFTGIYTGGFDYFSSVFEYLIKDYNKDSGKYAEYFTPGFAGNIMADILFNDTPVTNVSVYDPAAGSGTLLLSMANKVGTNNCTIYSQDISQKSTQFLRINLILNKLAHSLNYVIEGNTLTNPYHKDNEGNLKKFDFIVSNPPFNMDFSSITKTLNSDPFDRFFAGVPNIPNKKKSGMAIYQMFLQHILSSLSEKGKAAIVVPTGFVSAANGIPKVIREKMVDCNMLRAVVHMPSNIFATTNTSVSLIFLDKTKTNQEVMLVDASRLGTKTILEDRQRTLLSTEEIFHIIDTTKNHINKPEFSKLVSISDIKSNEYSFQAGQYVDMEVRDLEVDVEIRLSSLKKQINSLLIDSKKLDEKILNSFLEED